MYRYKSAFGTSHLRFIVMNNLFATVNPLHHRYDIKVTRGCCVLFFYRLAQPRAALPGLISRPRLQRRRARERPQMRQKGKQN
jgi:hypothetical protein